MKRRQFLKFLGLGATTAITAASAKELTTSGYNSLTTINQKPDKVSLGGKTGLRVVPYLQDGKGIEGAIYLCTSDGGYYLYSDGYFELIPPS